MNRESGSEAVERPDPSRSLETIYTDWLPGNNPVVRLASVLHEHVDDLDLNPEDIVVSLELLRLESDLDDRTAERLFLTVLASLISRRTGSVRFDVLDLDGTDRPLRERLRTHLAGMLSVCRESGDLSGGPGEAEDPWRELAGGIKELFQSPGALDIVGTPGDDVPLIVEDGQLYHQRSHAEEVRLAGFVRRRLIDGSRDDLLPGEDRSEAELRSALEATLRESSLRLTPEQQYGVLTAVCTPLSVITGGPGTGKTSLVMSILRLLIGLDVEADRIALAAPTGKAANRLAESISGGLDPSGSSIDNALIETMNEPRTLHRLLGYSPNRRDFYFDETRPLPHRYIIVDEASMVDLSLMERLFAAAGDEASIALIGDVDQLPAVDSGAVFRDLVPAEITTEVPWRTLTEPPLEEQVSKPGEPLAQQSVRLTENFRVRGGDPAAGNLLGVAGSLNRDDPELTFGRSTGDPASEPATIFLRNSFDELRFSGVEMLATDERPKPEADRSPDVDGESFTRFLESWYDRAYAFAGSSSPDREPGVDIMTEFFFRDGRPEGCEGRLEDLFALYNKHQLLTGTRRTPVGSEFINRYLHGHHRERTAGAGRASDPRFAVGEPVIMTHNDYDRRLFNGEQGVVLPVRRDSSGAVRPMAVFPGRERYRAFPLGSLGSSLNHAFALTVHKSQGSEYDVVAFILPRRDVPLMTRELLYTGVTRARRSVVFYGSRSRLRSAARKRDLRNSGLLERIG